MQIPYFCLLIYEHDIHDYLVNYWRGLFMQLYIAAVHYKVLSFSNFSALFHVCKYIFCPRYVKFSACMKTDMYYNLSNVYSCN